MRTTANVLGRDWQGVSTGDSAPTIATTGAGVACYNVHPGSVPGRDGWPGQRPALRDPAAGLTWQKQPREGRLPAHCARNHLRCVVAPGVGTIGATATFFLSSASAAAMGASPSSTSPAFAPGRSSSPLR